MPLERSGRKIRRESRILDDLLKQIVKERVRDLGVRLRKVLCDKKGYSLSDYERFIKWYNDFPRGRRIEVGLLIDVLNDLNLDLEEIIKEALRRRSYSE